MAKKKKNKLLKGLGVGAAMLVCAVVGFGVAQIPAVDNAINLDTQTTAAQTEQPADETPAQE